MKYLVCIVLVLNIGLLNAQYAINLGTSESPSRSISHKVGYTDISISYGSPSVKSRVIWGGLEKYDKVWRAGANYATTISFSENILINGQSIDKGQYSLFIIPKKEEPWIIILNTIAKQWGAFRYDEQHDIIRIQAEIKKIHPHENLRYDIVSNTSKSGRIVMQWDQIEVGFDFQTKLLDALTAQLETNFQTATPATRWINYIQVAEILLEENESLDMALKWINLAEDHSNNQMEWNPQYYPKAYVYAHLYWTKAKILAATGNKDLGIEYANKMKALDNQIFVDRMKEYEQFDKIIQSWSTQ